MSAKDTHLRVEDEALVRGRGRFTDDLKPADAVFACFVRSPHAHAEIAALDAAAAQALPGVLAIITAADLSGEGYGPVTRPNPMKGRDDTPIAVPQRPALAGERVLHVGEPVALVVAETLQAAQDAAEQVSVDYAPLKAITTVAQAAAGDAPELHPDAPGNLALDWAAPQDADGGIAARVEEAFAQSAHVAQADLVNQRLVAASLEPRGATASYDADADRYTLTCSSQGVASIRNQLVAAMKIEPERLRVLTEDVGGGFGMKASSYPEYVALLFAAKTVGRPVHWAATRSEAFMSDHQGRDSLWRAELALDADGGFLALKVDGRANVGAYLTGVGAICSTAHITGCLPSVYDIPLATVRTRCYLTNTVPIGAYRGAGRPEANYLLERLVDEAARVSGVDPAELRRRNLIAPDRMPYKTAFGNSYDSGQFPLLFEAALQRADHAGFPARRAASEAAGRLRGIGIGCYLEIAGALPQEAARVSFPGDGRAHVSIGAGPGGQGHVTVFRRLAAERLGVADEEVVIEHGDSARDIPGFGVVASRTATMVGGAIAQAAGEVLEKARPVAALLLQAGEEELVQADGGFSVAGSKRHVSIFDVAARAGELGESLDTEVKFAAASTFPNGCHVAEVEIEPETGAVSIVAYTAVDDCGKVLNPVIVDGQMHGGIAQGIGQALGEETVYDPESGQLVSGSFTDYALPRADTMPRIVLDRIEVACTTNPLGLKGTGEAGTTAAPSAVMNAIRHALPGDAGARLDMPATSEKVWRVLRKRAPEEEETQ
ncbi:MAG: xanthine dehydrogenase family protein molybdopterin-binding subunit [Hyphomicrobiales bacterium]|nr:xanthine dehydrogenase family protein molybdopterin-binding subunit [Hyphomicrobiales bacterium]